jgi:hypothetical protein
LMMAWAEFCPQAKLIVLLRDPVDRLVSAYVLTGLPSPHDPGFWGAGSSSLCAAFTLTVGTTSPFHTPPAAYCCYCCCFCSLCHTLSCAVRVCMCVYVCAGGGNTCVSTVWKCRYNLRLRKMAGLGRPSGLPTLAQLVHHTALHFARCTHPTRQPQPGASTVAATSQSGRGPWGGGSGCV